MLQELPRYLGEPWERTQELMARYLGSDVDLLDKTNRTLLENGGKQIRPMICLLSAQAACGRMAKASSPVQWPVRIRSTPAVSSRSAKRATSSGVFLCRWKPPTSP